ncbi:MAG TPA: polysaccharide deacetylase family protein [Steroidobacteraceae bacterium]|nr:polysaccharide deacetylase family protein [Steroidobacteraceae bacterium]
MRVPISRIAALLAAAAILFAGATAGAAKLKVALTFDDLPLNGTLPTGKKQSDFARDTIKVLKKHRIPPSYGFINANKLERNPDGAQALQIWAKGGHPLANHTYTHLDLTKNSVEDFQREILRNEPALELLMPSSSQDSGGKHGRWSWFRYPYLHEGDTLEKRRAVRAFLASSGYRIAQTTIDFEDYLWNSAHARCWMKKDAEGLDWLRESYRTAAREFIRLDIANSRAAFGRDIHHVMLLHLGSFSSHILPDLFDILDEEGFEIVTLEEAQKDPAYDYDPDVADPRGGTLVELAMKAKNIPWPANAPKKPRDRLAAICN